VASFTIEWIIAESGTCAEEKFVKNNKKIKNVDLNFFMMVISRGLKLQLG
jgi:hypothetical protein